MKILYYLILSALCGLFYRFGGADPPFRSWMRDWVCPAFAIGILLLWWHPAGYAWLLIPLMYGLTGGALSTYWKKKGTDANFWNYFLHGFFIALAMLPYSWATGHWIGFSIRLVVLPTAIAIWSAKTSLDVVEESGRGFLIGISLPLLLL